MSNTNTHNHAHSPNNHSHATSHSNSQSDSKADSFEDQSMFGGDLSIVPTQSDVDVGAMACESTTIVSTVPKGKSIRNELSVSIRDNTYTVSGWKACLVETAAIGLMAAGVMFLLGKAPSVESMTSTVSSTMSGLFSRK